MNETLIGTYNFELATRAENVTAILGVAAAVLIVVLHLGRVLPPPPRPLQARREGGLPVVFVNADTIVSGSPVSGCRVVLVTQHFVSLRPVVSLPPVIALSLRNVGVVFFDVLAVEDAVWWSAEARQRYRTALEPVLTRARGAFCACFEVVCFSQCLEAGSVPVWFGSAVPIAPTNDSYVDASQFDDGHSLITRLQTVFAQFASHVAWRDNASLVSRAYTRRFDPCTYATIQQRG